MPNKAQVTRKIGTIPFTASTRQQLRLDQDGVLMSLRLRLQYTITAGSSAMVTAKPFATTRLFKRIELTLNGKDTILNHDGPHLAARQVLDRGGRAFGTDATLVLTGSATVTSYDVVIEIPMALPRAISPMDTGLDFRRLSQAVLFVEWGDIGDIVVTTNSAAVSAVTCTVEGTFLAFPDDKAAYMVRDLSMIDINITAANTALSQLLDRGPYWLRSVQLMTVSDDVLVNTLLESGGVQIKSGSFSFFDRTGTMMRADQAHLYGLALAERFSGLYRAEFPIFGQGITMPNMGALVSDMYLNLNVLHPGTTDVVRVSREGIRDISI